MMAWRYSRETQWLVRQLRPFARLQTLSLTCISIASLVSLVDPLIMKWLIDEILPHKVGYLLPIAAGCLFLSYAARLAFQWIGSILAFRCVQRVVFNVRLSLFKHLEHLGANYHEQTQTGDTVFRIEQDVEQVAGLGTDIVPTSVRMLLVTLFVGVTMFALNWKLACLVLPLLPVFVILRKHFRSRLQARSDAVQQASGGLSSFLQECVAGMLQIQLLSRERAEARQLVRLSKSVLRAHLHRRMSEFRFSSYTMLIVAAAMALILGIGGRDVMSGSLMVGGLVAFYGYLMRLFEPMSNAVELYSRFHRAGASIRRILTLFDTVPNIQERAGARVLGSAVHELRIERVSFGYSGGAPVLKGIDITIKPGERIALVGVSGCGKSTVIKLLARLYDVGEGSILIDGIDIRDVRLNSLRAAISLVPQEPFLFHGTLRENMLCGNPQASQVDLMRAASIAQLLPVIEKHPAGWDQLLGPFGNGLSGGAKQRIALARAILQDRPVLILDEATSALDPPTEDAFLTALRRHCPRSTVVVISHRIAASRWADRAIAIHDGTVAHEITKADLLRNATAGFWSKEASPDGVYAAHVQSSKSVRRPRGSGSSHFNGVL